jgi:hypothetical protein
MTHLPITDAVPGGSDPRPTGASTPPATSTTSADAVRRPLSGFAVNAAPRHDRRPPTSRPARSAPSGLDALPAYRQCKTAVMRNAPEARADHGR